jgi:beta-phosphoglucomutase-like phosphatase (HAD superfamily)
MTSSGSAQASGVPASLQAELVAKLENYDRTFSTRAGNTARILLVVKAGSAKSEMSANEMRSALSRIERVGGLPHHETLVAYAGAAELAQRCRAERIAIVFVAAELEDAIEAIRAALTGASVLTVGALPSYVANGIVLGFELESGRPKIIVNLEQARDQNVNFSSDVLRLMKVYR